MDYEVCGLVDDWGTTLHYILARQLEQGWFSFLEMLKGSLKHGKFECWQELQGKASVQTRINFPLPESSSSKSHNFHYTEIVKKSSVHQTSVSSTQKHTCDGKKSNGLQSPVPALQKQTSTSIWLMKNYDILEEDFSNL